MEENPLKLRLLPERGDGAASHSMGARCQNIKHCTPIMASA